RGGMVRTSTCFISSSPSDHLMAPVGQAAIASSDASSTPKGSGPSRIPGMISTHTPHSMQRALSTYMAVGLSSIGRLFGPAAHAPDTQNGERPLVRHQGLGGACPNVHDVTDGDLVHVVPFTDGAA